MDDLTEDSDVHSGRRLSDCRHMGCDRNPDRIYRDFFNEPDLRKTHETGQTLVKMRQERRKTLENA